MAAAVEHPLRKRAEVSYSSADIHDDTAVVNGELSKNEHQETLLDCLTFDPVACTTRSFESPRMCLPAALKGGQIEACRNVTTGQGGLLNGVQLEYIYWRCVGEPRRSCAEAPYFSTFLIRRFFTGETTGLHRWLRTLWFAFESRFLGAQR